MAEKTKTLVIEPITTPNKNITSFFDKKEISYLVNVNHKYPTYSFEKVYGILFETKLILYSKTKEMPVVTEEQISSLYTEQTIEFESSDFRSIEALLSTKIRQFLKPCNSSISLAISDFFNKDQVVQLVDLFLNTLQFRAIQLNSFGLLAAIKLREPNLAIKYAGESKQFVFIEEFTVIESFTDSKCYQWLDDTSMADNEDVADEFSRLKTINYANKWCCQRCCFYEDTEDKIIKHIEKDHKCPNSKEYFEYVNNDNDFDKMVEYIYLGKQKKIEGNTRIIDLNTNYETDSTKISPFDLLVSGVVFNELDASKETWLTDKEWAVARIRLLKEKILFYI
ncbi:hypothetical protein ECANGB1_1251 [Enterospora canceri]|uniref:Uncharacterized protein n=1 Tax=Enterospora canceri TaxID=1081671 RepID=A0A1Y1S7M4_9MICR|nr:hypothetical protein ECANGB1_1251 [Enterospora canceri]